MKSTLTLICSIFLLFATGVAQTKNNYTQYVNPLIGSAGHGHVFVGANVPFGAVQLGPNNIFEGWDWCSGYHYSSNNIIGFSHTHLSGTGIGDMGDVLIMPATGNINLFRGDKNNIEATGYGSTFSHSNEVAKPGYYSVVLNKYKIKAELTTTNRVGFHQYQFPEKAVNPHVLIDLNEGIGWDAPQQTYIEKLDNSTLIGYRLSKGWANDQRVYFVIKLSQPVQDIQLYDSSSSILNPKTSAKGKRIKAVLVFNNINNNVLQIKVAISPVSINNAQQNLVAELAGWNFNKVAQDAQKQWNTALGKIDIYATDSVKNIFYTAMYHSMVAPSTFSDVNKQYFGADKQMHTANQFTNYTTFSLWDTYRAWHPLATLIYTDKVNDYVNTMLNIYKQQGKLPVWHLHGNETNTMVGYHAVPVIVDAYLKGFRNYDIALAYEAVKHSAMQQKDGIQFIQKLQYIPADSVNESVAKALEYCIDDWGIAQMAKALGKTNDYNYFTQRANLYKQYFDKNVGFMRGKMANGTWRHPFNPLSSKHREDDYCEGNAWQYTWLVPHDVNGLIELFGGKENFEKKLDQLFITDGEMGAEQSPDISGLIGQYAQGNEPNHHILYLYNYANKPHKTAQRVRQSMQQFFTAQPDGLCGNEDVGQMSAWYIFSALGFYPVNPMNGEYMLGSPAINKATIYLAKGKKTTINVLNNSAENIYIKSITVNGKPYLKNYFSHQLLTSGANIEIKMSSTW